VRDREREAGKAELIAARRESRGLFWAVGLFSVFVNALMLTGPIFMLQVYDRVLGSRSEETLLALAILVTFLYAMMGILDFARGRLLARIGARFQSKLDQRVFAAALKRSAVGKARQGGVNELRDLETVQRLISSPVTAALYDLPWTPVFLVGIAIFHPWLGMLAVGGGCVLVIITIFNQLTTRGNLNKAGATQVKTEKIADQIQTEAEMVQSLGMRGAAFKRWQKNRAETLSNSVSASDWSGGFTVTSKTFRLFLQSAMLGLGAYLVLQGELTPGAMIAGSILLGRALQPIDIVIGQWSTIQAAMRGWNHLADLLGTVPPEQPRTALPRPEARLVADQLTVVPPGEHQASLRMVSFELEPGKALGVIGPSGAGKSTLARAITGVWRPAGGKIRLGGASVEHYDPDVLGCHVGYLPQRVQLFDGTITENIARLSENPDHEKVVQAAIKADAHDMILKLPQGYDTPVTAGGGRLSGGQMQRIGLARALYGDPVLLVLDEPNSNLDNEGSMALNKAIRQLKSEGCSVMIMAHRPAAIQECEYLLVIENGAKRAFGPRDEVLKNSVANHKEITKTAAPGGVT